MAFEFLRSLFRREPEAPAPDLAGPLDLRPGDEVEYYQRRFRVKGVILLSDELEERHQYHLVDGRGREAVLVAEGDREIVLSLQQPLPADAEVRVTAATLGGVEYRRSQEGTAESSATGEIPPGKSGTVEAVEFEDDEEMHLIVLETWGAHSEARAGEYIHEGELTIHRAGEESFVIQAPPRVDMRTLTEARRARDAAEAKASSIDEAGSAWAERTREDTPPGDQASTS